MCGEDSWRCPQGTCLTARDFCNGEVHCSDGSDEPVTCGRLNYCLLIVFITHRMTSNGGEDGISVSDACLQERPAHWTMVAVAMSVWIKTGGLCVSAQLDSSSPLMELSVKVCGVKWKRRATLLSGGLFNSTACNFQTSVLSEMFCPQMLTNVHHPLLPALITASTPLDHTTVAVKRDSDWKRTPPVWLQVKDRRFLSAKNGPTF